MNFIAPKMSNYLYTERVVGGKFVGNDKCRDIQQ